MPWSQAAFLIPLLSILKSPGKAGLRGVILAPTRVCQLPAHALHACAEECMFASALDFGRGRSTTLRIALLVIFQELSEQIFRHLTLLAQGKSWRCYHLSKANASSFSDPMQGKRCV